MLSALELAGFKSFAEKTRFEFPDGITVIVGPNGSGKSNVVDAIKWVLGAQSAKALRGKDMVDVIFKGSSSAGRKPANSAEATLVFDNSEKHLTVDADEVHVTRRVYRSGDSEYLLNGQTCRLKDIKDLFRGTGVGVDAYSLIEQGKVDRMLQASPKDRRTIFEEAAGISRFNAKKVEANRRLGRVDQNLTRLKDIVDEVHTRLNALKNQASKAQRYREMTSRLQELRLRLGWTEHCQLAEKQTRLSEKLDRLRSDSDAKQSELEEARREAQSADLALHKVAGQCQEVEGVLQDTLQKIAVGQNQQQSVTARLGDTQDEQRRQETRLATLRSRAGSIQQEVDTLRTQAQAIQQVYDAAQNRSRASSANLAGIRTELAERNSQHDHLRKQHVDLLREVSEKAAQVAQQKNLLGELQQSIYQTEQTLRNNRAAEQAARKTAEQAAHRLKQIHEQNHSSTEALTNTKDDLDRLRTALASQQEESAVLQGRLEGTTERLELLQQLEQHLEGVDAGARHILDLASESNDPAFQSVHGLVAELLDVEVDLAPLIDTALGTSANALVLDNGDLIRLIRTEEIAIPGRLSLMRLDRLPTRRFGEKIQLDGVSGVVGRADRLVKSRHQVAPLIRYLLGTTWLVESLDIALDLGHFRGAGLRFVTAACELIEADGTLTIGALQSSAGLVSRRSEIQNAKEEIEEIKRRYQKSQGEIERLTGRIGLLAPQVQDLENQAKELSQEFARQQASAQNAVSKLDAIEADAALLATNLSDLNQKRSSIEPSITDANTAVGQLHAQVADLEKRLSEQESAIRSQDANLAEATQEETSAQVELAREEQRLESAKIALEQSSRSAQERQNAVTDAEQELLRLQTKQRQGELEILEITSMLSEAYVLSEAEEEKLDGLALEADRLRKLRITTSKRLDSVQRTIDKTNQQRETCELELERYTESSQALLKRFVEDYQIEYDQLSTAELISDENELDAMDAEAATIRQDIASVGEINMAALAELDELQNRYDTLHGQYEDLQSAKESLQRIIQKINQDSRRMFMETLEIIRQNFQKLYRKSFGGGNADIVLEEGEDVLECGIDIIATPPGKTALSNSLLSGGEKALTAVALLLAIFQYRPSPFCVLDEVDAPFDEANIGRFVNVLTEFLDWTKFIIVTHSKKTMTASTTLYGVTMQESGVSKQVAVRFEDVNDKGEIISPSSRRNAA